VIGMKYVGYHPEASLIQKAISLKD